MWCCYADQELQIVGINFELSLFHGGFYVTIHKTTELKNSNPFERYCGLHVNYRTWEFKSIGKILWIMYDYPQNYKTWELEAIESYVNCGIIFEYKQDLWTQQYLKVDVSCGSYQCCLRSKFCLRSKENYKTV